MIKFLLRKLLIWQKCRDIKSMCDIEFKRLLPRKVLISHENKKMFGIEINWENSKIINEKLIG